MSYQIIDEQNASQYIWGKNCKSWVLCDSLDLSIKLESMPTGSKETLHYHNKAQQFFYILKGVAHFIIEDTTVEVGSKQGILIPPKTKHFMMNASNEALEFLVISQPSTQQDRINIEL